jgi:predicted transcriptional regulator
LFFFLFYQVKFILDSKCGNLVESGNWNKQKLIKSNGVFNAKVPDNLANLEEKQMRRAKLEMYVDILKVLAHLGPLTMTNIMHRSTLNNSVIKGYLVFLIKQGLVEERKVMMVSSVFAVTSSGINVLKYFQEIPQEISVMRR